MEASRHQAPRNRVTLTKAALNCQEGLDLLILCETMTADGRITNDEVRLLQKWLVWNQHSSLPAIEFLAGVVEQIIADGRITPQERDALHSALERVLPPPQRRESQARRQEFAQDMERLAVERSEARRARAEAIARENEERQAREEQERYAESMRGERALVDIDFSVAGISHEDRSMIVQHAAREGDTVFLIRDRRNTHSPNAIEVRLKTGQRIGYVPERLAVEWAPLFDSGHRHLAYIRRIYNPDWNATLFIPIIEGGIYIPGSQFPGAVTESQVPAGCRGSYAAQDEKQGSNSFRSVTSTQQAATASSRHENTSGPDPHLRRVLIASAILITLIVVALFTGD